MTARPGPAQRPDRSAALAVMSMTTARARQLQLGEKECRELRSWKLAAGSWKLEAGSWKLEAEMFT
jgi:hypothetical protein